ncbi:hypothetical protein B0T40_16500 [Chromobacterium haemolyticum]|uniref:ESPR domain-containing protein n=2 Tax=Chromobacterium haemolyticum TaxID=394935 RepID=UPI0009D99217|nr:ESPR domain-containing protein [Chromobacterium haemolyticum]OQS33960.1 hypothetical protein B0T40_16500 [Chromobacterium haemolyticum]
MNKIFQLKWSDVVSGWVVTSELSSSVPARRRASRRGLLARRVSTRLAVLSVLVLQALTPMQAQAAYKVQNFTVQKEEVGISQLAWVNVPLEVGQILSATYQFADSHGDAIDQSVYLYGYSDTAGRVAAEGQKVEKSGAVPDRPLTAEDVGKLLELSVQARSDVMAGNTLTINTQDLGNGGLVIDPQAKPVVQDLKLKGKLEVGQRLSGSYVFDANKGEATDKSKALWGKKGSTAGQVDTQGQVVATSGQLQPYTIQSADAGTVLEVSVQPENARQAKGKIETATTETLGEGGSVIDPQAKPLVKDLKLKGKLEVGESLNGSYVFDANKGEATDKSKVLWGKKGSTAGQVDTQGQVVATSGQLQPYTIQSADAGTVLEVSVQPENARQAKGKVETATTEALGEGGSVIDPKAKPLVKDLTLKGKLEVGQSLNGSYTFDANKGEATDKSKALWGKKGNTAGQVDAQGQVVKQSGQLQPYTIQSADAGTVLEVSVQPENARQAKGKVETATTEALGEGGSVIDPQAKPLVKDLTLKGKLEVGQSLNGSYTFDANKGEATDKSKALWGKTGNTAGQVDAQGQVVKQSGQLQPYTIQAADAGTVLEVSVQPENARQAKGQIETATTEALGEGGSVIDPKAKPLVKDLKLTGKLEVGQSLNGSYTFDANKGEATDKSKVLWGKKGNTAGQVDKQGQVVKQSGQLQPYTIQSADAGSVLEVSVQPENARQAKGQIETATTEALGEGGSVIDPQAKPLVKDLKLTGKLEVGQSLNGSYAFDANKGEGTDKSKALWGKKGNTAGQVDTQGQVVKQSGQLQPYTIQSADAGTVLEVSV